VGAVCAEGAGGGGGGGVKQTFCVMAGLDPAIHVLLA
jgi:hypothetical protein